MGSVLEGSLYIYHVQFRIIHPIQCSLLALIIYEYLWHKYLLVFMVLKLDGNSDIGVPEWSEIGNIIFLLISLNRQQSLN